MFRPSFFERFSVVFLAAIAVAGLCLIELFFVFRISGRFVWVAEASMMTFAIIWVGCLVWIARLLEKLARADRLARIDELTGLPNRRALLEKLDAAIHGTFPVGGGFVIAMLDCDGFKRVNDQFGHPFGDEVLRRIAAALSESIRPNVFVSRLGGDEFCLIFSDLDLEESKSIINGMRTTLRNQMCNEYPDLTYSIGLIAIPAVEGAIQPGLDPMECLKQVDRVMYAAKGEGVDCTRCETIDCPPSGKT